MVTTFATLDNRRFGSALLVAAAVDQTVDLQRAVAFSLSSASQSGLQRATPKGRDGPAASAAGATFAALGQHRAKEHCTRKNKKLSHRLSVKL